MSAVVVEPFSADSLRKGTDLLLGRPRFGVLGVPLQNLHRTEIVAVISDAIRKRQRKYRVVHANAHLVTLALERPWLRELFARSEVAFCDGAGVQVASLVLNNLRLQRTTPPEWIEEVGRAIAPAGGSVFWLGGAPDIVADAAAEFTRRTGARTAGHHHGFFDSSADSAENDAVIEMINAARPDLLIVNMGMPLQEWWISQSWDRLDVCVVMTAGALVDHLAGRVRRPPRWVSNAGLEWAVRLVVEPRRLWRRYLLGLPTFGMAILLELLRSPIRSLNLHRSRTPPLGNAETSRSDP